MIGIDVGGANLKVVDKSGVHIHYCPLWSGAPLSELLGRYAGSGDEAAVVMSGELADCFSNKQEGIAFITAAVKKAFPRARFYGTDAKFHDGPVPALAAANWLASADYLRSKYPDAVVLDIGSTTADIIPLNRFSSLLDLTDLLRLQKGYLVYTGMLRTPVATLVSSVDVHSVPTPVSYRIFRSERRRPSRTRPHRDRNSTPAMHRTGRRRPAKHPCAGLPGWSAPISPRSGRRGALAVASAFWDRQRTMIRDAVARVKEESGCFIGYRSRDRCRDLCKRVRRDGSNAALGPAADALPAYAVREVAVRTRGN